MKAAQGYAAKLRDVKEDFTELKLPEHFGQLAGELDAIKARLRAQLQAEIQEDRAKLALEWEKLKQLQRETGQVVAGKLHGATEAVRERVGDARENLRERFDSVSMPPQMAALKQELEKALGSVHLPPALNEQLERLQRAAAAERAELAQQLEKLKQSHAAEMAAAAAAAAGAAAAGAAGKALAFISGGATAEAGEGSASGAKPSLLSRMIAPVREMLHHCCPCDMPSAA